MFKAKKKAWILGISVLALSSVVLGYLWISVLPREQIKHRSFSYLQQTWREIPIADKTRLIYQTYFGCTNDQSAGMRAVLASDLPPEAISSHYSSYLQQTHWNSGGSGHNDVGQWFLDATKPFPQADWQFLAFELIATKSATMDSSRFSSDEGTSVEQAVAASESMTTIILTYRMDQTVFDREHQGIDPFSVESPCNNVPNAHWRIVNP